MKNFIAKMREVNSYRRRVGRRNHSEERLKERFNLEYVKVKNIINNGGFEILLREGQNRICRMFYRNVEIYFIMYQDEIKTFMTKNMIENSYPGIFSDRNGRTRCK